MVEEHDLLSVGEVVRGRYIIRSVIGAGSTGAVYLVKDQQEQTSPFLALKEIQVSDQQARYHFIIEGTSLRQLQHSALPRVRHLFNDDKRGCVYIVMDYIDGERLAEVAWSTLNWSRLRAWCEPLVATLSYLHLQEQPVFHGDLKPANLVRARSGKMMLVDLGYVAQESETDRPNPYRAPEQFAGIIDERSDVYGCGALIYTLLTGAEPMDAFTRHERVSQKRTDSLVLANKLSPAVSRELAEVLQRALALDPAERFASVKAFWEALNPLAVEFDRQPVNSAQASISPGSVPATTPLPGRQPEPARVARRWLLPAIAVVCALLLLLAGIIAWTLGAPRGRSTVSTSPSPLVTASASSSRSTPGSTVIPSIIGRYSGTFTPAATLQPVSFTVLITRQEQQNFSGQFISTQKTGTISGVIDAAHDLHWTVVDATGNAILYFYGGLNGIGSTQDNTQDNMGGTFSACVPDRGSQCVLSMQSNSSSDGPWSASYISSASIDAPPAHWLA